MNQIETLPAPVLQLPVEDKWQRERQAFRRLLPKLLKTHRDQYVAIHGEQVVESGADKLEVAGRAYAKFGYVPIYVAWVTDEPPIPIRLPSPRILQPDKGS